jgi:site-specific recombinase XerD
MKYFFRDQGTLSKFHIHPLGKYMNAYAEWLHDSGYSRDLGRAKIRMVARLSPWLKRHGIAAVDLTWEHIQQYLEMKVRKGRKLNHDDARTLRQFMRFLDEQEVIQGKTVIPVGQDPLEQLLYDYTRYLKNERALSPGSIVQYKRHVSRFLIETFSEAKLDLSILQSCGIASYVRVRAAETSKSDSKLMCTALRSFLRYARYQGFIDFELDACVPTVANWRMASLPKALPPDAVEKVLNSCDRETAIGQRDYAILLTLARLGLRAGEVVSLQLEDIDWRMGTITVRGKGSTLSQMPLPADVGQAIVLYLQKGRPKCSSRAIFVRAQAPKKGLARSGAICNIVRQALERAGIRMGRGAAHKFRHALATNLLQKGASLPDIAELLRHRTLECTTIYAKVDLSSLRTLAVAWPGGAQ